MTVFGCSHAHARTAGVCAVAAATGFAGLALTGLPGIPQARNLAVALTSTDTAQEYLTGPGLLPDDQYPAYTMSTFLTGDTQVANSELDHAASPWATSLITLNNDFWDFTHVGYLTDGSLTDAATLLPGASAGSLFVDQPGPILPEVSPLGAITHVAGTAPQAGETASQLMAQVQAEGNLLTENAAAVHNEIWATVLPGGPNGTDLANEYGPVNDDWIFQTEINDAVASLHITAADEHNPVLIYDLSNLLTAENSMNDTLVDLDTSWATDQTMQLTADNAALAQNGDAIFDATQNIVSFFAFEDFLQEIGL